MKNNRYIILISVRVLLICLNCFAVFWLISLGNRPVTLILAIITVVIQVIGLVRFHTKAIEGLANYLQYLQQNDTVPKAAVEKVFHGLSMNLNMIHSYLQQSRIREEQQYQFIQAILKQVETGIVVFNTEGKIEIFNQAAKEILGIEGAENITDITAVYPVLKNSFTPDQRTSSPVKIRTRGREYALAFKHTKMKVAEKTLTIISFQNIFSELEESELDAWRKLLRIQRHEIINTITPVTTLTTAIKRLLNRSKSAEGATLSGSQLEDAVKSIDVIEERSLGLIGFIERVKTLTEKPELKKTDFRVFDLAGNLALLFADILKEKKIVFETEVKPVDLEINADENLVEQVLINLIKNAIESIDHDHGTVRLEASSLSKTQVSVKITDNGKGIDKNTMENIFIPSFTTKENGSGIGLSITRHIVQMHNGHIFVRSTPGEGTTFEIIL